MATNNTAAGAPAASKPLHPSDHRSAAEVSRQEIQAAIAKAVELRALHAALLQSNSPAHLRFPATAASPASPLPQNGSQLSAQDYPVFTPSYDDLPRNQSLPTCWDECSINGGTNDDSRFLSDYRNPNTSSRTLLPPDLMNFIPHTCPSDDQNSVTASSNHHITTVVRSPEFSKSRRNSLGDFRSTSSCNRCKPATLSSNGTGNNSKNHKYGNLVVPMTDSHSSDHTRMKPKAGLSLSWFFPRLSKKKHKNVERNEPVSPDETSSYMGTGIEKLREELAEANARRDSALMEVSEMKSSIGDLQEKLEYLENYCEELKKALSQAMVQQTKESENSRSSRVVMTKGKPVDSNSNLNANMPVSNEVMVEGFMQIVSEARLSVKQFCKVLVSQLDEGDTGLLENLNASLQPHKLSLHSKYSKAVLYHLEAIINQSLYQDFENRVFQKNGCAKILDPNEERHAKFSSFCALRNLSWNEVLRKGTKYYSEDFSRFCDEKMSGIIASVNWTRPWPEQLLQAFFVAAKCVWLLHLLAFSFDPALEILRVEENRSFDGAFMEDVFVERQRAQNPTRVKVMVMPGFYVQDSVLRCKVLCRYKSAG